MNRLPIVEIGDPIAPYLNAKRCATCHHSSLNIAEYPCRPCRKYSHWRPTEVLLYWWELLSIDDYSCTLPSGTVIGKVWRRRAKYRDTDDEATHFVGVYIDDPDPKQIGIMWLAVVYRHGPEPRNYFPPDWANYQRYLQDRKAVRS